ncbi:MAG: CapA family protein, partial [Phycisphaerae bacterium]
MPNILIGGDLCPIGRNQSLFEQGNAALLLNDLLPEFENADLSIVNLECPLIRDESPIVKCGPVLGAPTTCVNGMKAASINMFNLANNHIMDHGTQGLQTTIETLEQHGIMHVGAGTNLDEARK